MRSILLIADTQGWIFHRHCLEIKNRIKEYSFDIKFAWKDDPSKYEYNNYDLIYQLDPMSIPSLNPPSQKTILGLRNEFMYNHSQDGIKSFYNNTFHNKCCVFHVVNKNQFREFSLINSDISILLVQHGVDTSCFKPNNKKIILQNNPLTIGISGNNNSSGEKGFAIVEEACRITKSNLFTSKQNLNGTHNNKNQMAEYYNKIDIYCCMSKSEGLNNCIMEAGATAVPVISTKTGAVEEMIENGTNGFIINRDVKSLVEKIEFFKNNRFCINDFGNKFMNEIKNKWSWDIKIKEFQRMFRSFFDFKK